MAQSFLRLNQFVAHKSSRTTGILFTKRSLRGIPFAYSNNVSKILVFDDTWNVVNLICLNWLFSRWVKPLVESNLNFLLFYILDILFEIIGLALSLAYIDYATYSTPFNLNRIPIAQAWITSLRQMRSISFGLGWLY